LVCLWFFIVSGWLFELGLLLVALDGAASKWLLYRRRFIHTRAMVHDLGLGNLVGQTVPHIALTKRTLHRVRLYGLLRISCVARLLLLNRERDEIFERVCVRHHILTTLTFHN